MPMNRALYPPDWDAISIAVRTRAGWKCETCGAENAKPHPVTGSHVVLTVAHLDHMPGNCDPQNLRVLCQRCHFRLDAEQHLASRQRRLKERPEMQHRRRRGRSASCPS
jgi:hypothetical protein